MLYKALCTDDTPMVRRAAASKLGVRRGREGGRGSGGGRDGEVELVGREGGVSGVRGREREGIFKGVV